MPSFSQVNLLGYIGNDVALKAGKKTNYLQLSIGITKAFKRKKLEDAKQKWETKTRWLKVMLFGQYAIYASERLHKGELVHVAGELEVSEWTDVSGKKHYDTYVLASNVISIAPNKKAKVDHNYGVPEVEIVEEFI